MHIKRVRARNFLSVGDEPVEIDFTKLGPVINIIGRNHDYGEGASNGAGKCFGLNTPILMYDGTIEMVQHIRVGDLLMGDDGTPRTVLSLASGNDQLYKVVPTKGAPYVVNSEHVLVLKSGDKKDKHFRHHPTRVGDEYHIRVKDYLIQSATFKNITKGVRAPADWPTRSVPIDPYILGVWLGDGHSRSSTITSVDNEVVAAFENCGEQRSLFTREVGKHGYCLTSGVKIKGINSFTNELKILDVWGNKHIPHAYKANDRNVRLQLLAGLIDTDGYAGNGYYEITQKNRQLAEGILFVARSLGFGAHMKPCTKRSQRGTVGVYYRVNISGDCDKIPVRIPRKKLSPRQINKDVLKVGIQVVPIGEGKYYGFQTDGNQKYLLGDFTVVHNSTVTEMIVYALYGKLLKGLNHKAASHIHSKRGAELEIEVDDLRIVRRRSPDTLELYERGEKVMDAGLPETQAEINRRLRLSFDGFVNVACFGQHSFNGFLQSEPKRKREVAENLLGLDHYARYHEVAKKQRAYLQDSIKELKIKYEAIADGLRRASSRLVTLRSQQSQWIRGKQTEIQNLESRVMTLQAKLSSGIAGMEDYGAAIARIDAIAAEVADQEKKRNESEKNLTVADAKLESLRDERDVASRAVAVCESDLKEAKKIAARTTAELQQLEESAGSTCPTCYGTVQPERLEGAINKLRGERDSAIARVIELEQKLQPLQQGLNELLGRYDKVVGLHKKIKSSWLLATGRINELLAERSRLMKVQAPDQQTAAWEKELELLHARIEESRREMSEADPFAKMIVASEGESADCHEQMGVVKEDIEQKEKLLPYYEYWVKGFGDKGIRSFLLEERLPTINRRLNFWLQILIDNRLRLTFDRDLNDTIRRVPDDNKKFVYHALSGGELSRIDLSISHAFAFATMTASKACPSLISLDEVGTNFDRPGIHAVYRMIQELAKERQVLVVTHDVDLQEMLKNCDTIVAVMKNGVTTIETISRR